MAVIELYIQNKKVDDPTTPYLNATHHYMEFVFSAFLFCQEDEYSPTLFFPNLKSNRFVVG
jgi:hypothetical protein